VAKADWFLWIVQTNIFPAGLIGSWAWRDVINRTVTVKKSVFAELFMD